MKVWRRAARRDSLPPLAHKPWKSPKIRIYYVQTRKVVEKKGRKTIAPDGLMKTKELHDFPDELMKTRQIDGFLGSSMSRP